MIVLSPHSVITSNWFCCFETQKNKFLSKLKQHCLWLDTPTTHFPQTATSIRLQRAQQEHFNTFPQKQQMTPLQSISPALLLTSPSAFPSILGFSNYYNCPFVIRQRFHSLPFIKPSRRRSSFPSSRFFHDIAAHQLVNEKLFCL